MIFNSFTYLIFLTLTVAGYWLLPRGPRLWLLLIASIVFYGFWRFSYVPLLFVSIIVDYVAARMIFSSHSSRKRKMLLAISLVVNFSLLGFFKYFYFITDTGIGLASYLGIDINAPALNIILPIGISFYTFQSVSYTIDVYRNKLTPQKNFLLFANYVTFFPQLVAGPILRAGEITWQLDKRPKFSTENLSAGILRISGGLLLKVVLADNIAPLVDAGFETDPTTLSAIDVTTLAFLFGFQIYFDFAAYSHIAMGSARLMGIRFPENFNFPYSAKSPKTFWRKWHITLSSWIRDYLYLPLLKVPVRDESTGGIGQEERLLISETRKTAALFITWALMGLWHGAGWTFVIWGLWHACLVWTERKLQGRHHGSGGIVFSGLVRFIWLFFLMLAWIPFRATSTSDMLSMLSAFITPDRWFFLGFRENTYLVTAIVFLGVMFMPAIWRKAHLWADFSTFRTKIAGAAAITAGFGLLLVYLRPLSQFIYFQF